MVRILLSLVVVVAAAVVGVIGVLGWGAAAVCDTSCPSDQTLETYKLMARGGGIAVLLGIVALVVFVRRRSRNA
jgi:hypothetical protein